MKQKGGRNKGRGETGGVLGRLADAHDELSISVSIVRHPRGQRYSVLLPPPRVSVQPTLPLLHQYTDRLHVDEFSRRQLLGRLRCLLIDTPQVGRKKSAPLCAPIRTRVTWNYANRCEAKSHALKTFFHRRDNVRRVG